MVYNQAMNTDQPTQPIESAVAEVLEEVAEGNDRWPWYEAGSPPDIAVSRGFINVEYLSGDWKQFFLTDKGRAALGSAK